MKRPCDLPGPYEIVVDADGQADTLVQAIRALEPEGVVTSVTLHLRPMTSLPLMEMYHKGVLFYTGRPNVRAHIEPVLAAGAHGRFKPNLIDAKLYPFDDAPEAWMDPSVRTAAARA